jgi:hypothetical protein
VVDDWGKVRRKPVAAEPTQLAIANNLLGYKKIIKNTSRQDFQGLLARKRRKPRKSHRLKFMPLFLET